jgi:hypothetical protein
MATRSFAAACGRFAAGTDKQRFSKYSLAKGAGGDISSGAF